MDKKDIIKRIDELTARLLIIEAKQTVLLETKAYCQNRWERLQHQKRQVHDEVTMLKVKILKMGL